MRFRGKLGVWVVGVDRKFSGFGLRVFGFVLLIESECL